MFRWHSVARWWISPFRPIMARACPESRWVLLPVNGEESPVMISVQDTSVTVGVDGCEAALRDAHARAIVAGRHHR